MEQFKTSDKDIQIARLNSIADSKGYYHGFHTGYDSQCEDIVNRYKEQSAIALEKGVTKKEIEEIWDAHDWGEYLDDDFPDDADFED